MKYQFSPLTNLTNESTAVETINNNFTALQTLAEKFVSRDGASPNTMEADLDMNSKRLTNLPAPLNQTEPLRLKDWLDAGIGTFPPGSVAASLGYTPFDAANFTSANIKSTLGYTPANAAANSVYVNDYLLVSDTYADNAFALAIAALGSDGGRLTFTGRLRLQNLLTIPKDTELVGSGPVLGHSGYNQSTPYSQRSCLFLSTSGIKLSSNSAIRDVLLIRDGLTLPATSLPSFTGTSLSIDHLTDDVLVENVMSLGFEYGFKVNPTTPSTSTVVSRVRIIDFPNDCLNGVDVLGMYDSSLLLGVHCWPYTTIQQFALTGASNYSLIQRAGIGIKIGAGADDMYMDRCLSAYHTTDFDFSGASFRVGSIWSEMQGTVSGSKGVNFNSGCDNIHIESVVVWGHEKNIYFNTQSVNSITIDNLLTRNGTVENAEFVGGRIFIKFMDSRNSASSAGRYTNVLATVNIDTLFTQNNTYANDLRNDVSNLPVESFKVKTLRSDKAAGTGLYGNIPPQYTVLSAAATLNLQPSVDEYAVTGAGTLSTLAGGHHGRRVTIVFVNGQTISSAGNFVLAANYSAASGQHVTFYYDSGYAKWAVFPAQP